MTSRNMTSWDMTSWDMMSWNMTSLKGRNPHFKDWAYTTLVVIVCVSEDDVILFNKEYQLERDPGINKGLILLIYQVARV